MFNRLYLIVVVAGLSVAQARAADHAAGYLISSDGAPVASGYGGCVRTSQWTPDASYRQCDPLPVAMQVAPAAPLRITIETLFEFDSALLSADAGPAFDGLLKQLSQADYQTVAIVGRADRLGRAKYNQQLSEQRAEAVRDYLVAHGIDGSKIAISGAGSTESVTRSQCKGLQGEDLVSCLQPDRSAEVRVIGRQASAMR
jgi:outer membrane protein OmpA-like peptidoglycan-associated protein